MESRRKRGVKYQHYTWLYRGRLVQPVVLNFLLSESVHSPCREPSLWCGASAPGCPPPLPSSQQEDPTPSLYSPNCQTLQKMLSSWTKTRMEMFISLFIWMLFLGRCFFKVTWNRRLSPLHWCGWSLGPRIARAHFPSATHRLSCPTDKDATHVSFIWCNCRIRIDILSWNWITHVHCFFILWYSFCSLSAVLWLCKHARSPLRSLQKESPSWKHPMTGRYLWQMSR